MHTVGGLIFPGSPLAETKAQLETIAGFWPDINKSRDEAKRLLREAGAEGLSFELVNRNVDQPYKYLGTWLIDQWGKIGLHVTQRVVPGGPWFAALRSGDFQVSTGGNCHGIVNPVIDIQTWLSHSISSQNYGYYEDPKADEIYDKMLHETDVAKQRALAYRFDKRVLGEEVHYIQSYWWNRLVPLRSYVHGRKFGSKTTYANQDLSNDLAWRRRNATSARRRDRTARGGPKRQRNSLERISVSSFNDALLSLGRADRSALTIRFLAYRQVGVPKRNVSNRRG